MIIECTSCHSKYQYDEKRFEGKPSKKIKCARCQHVFDVYNPAVAPAKPAVDDTRTARPAPPPDKTEQSSLPSAVPEVALRMPAGKRLSLAILEGPDAGTVFRIEKPRVTIGRANADLTLNDTEASRQHAVVEVRDTQYRLSDLGSTNGTLFEGSKISAAVDLSDKAEFQIGATTLMLIVTDEH